MQPVIISGGPGAGKTTLLEALAKRGYPTFSEVPRMLIEQQSSIEGGILPWHDLPGFAHLCLVAMEQQKQLASQHTLAFLDRAVPDICGYLSLAQHTIDPAYLEASKGYHPVVFFCAPERSIYVQDEVRPYPFDQAMAIHHALIQTYQQQGYEVCEVPFMAVAERVAFVLSQLDQKAPD